MPKALTISGMIVAALLLILFGLDLATSITFKQASKLMDICFIISSLILGYLSWSAYREQV